MTHGAAAIRELLDRHGIRPSRALGQNFVVDPNTVRRIAALAGVEPGDRVLEIGPGLGSLTLALAERGGHVTAVELDRHVLPALEEATAGITPPVTIVGADALEVDLAALLGEGDDWILAANLPYNVGTTILLRVLETAPAVRRGIVLVQREVAQRLAATVGDKTYGIPSVKLAWWARAAVVGRVPATVFHPRPKVESALVSFERRIPPGEPDLRAVVFGLVDAGFNQRRKMLRRSLAAHFDESTIVAAGLDPTARAERLTIDDWVALGHQAMAAGRGSPTPGVGPRSSTAEVGAPSDEVGSEDPESDPDHVEDHTRGTPSS